MILPKSDQNLIWLDCEMSGLNPEKDKLLEIAVVVTSHDLSIRVPSPVFVVHQEDAILQGMDHWNQKTHGRPHPDGSGSLIDKVRSSTLTETQIENELLDFISLYVPKLASPMCGNTIQQDRRFLVKYCPRFEDYFHYRCLDVSTLKELAKRWNPTLYSGFKKRQQHTALADVMESIDELAYYREHFLKIPS